jgi:RIO-like serine/threonine protein kinase
MEIKEEKEENAIKLHKIGRRKGRKEERKKNT